VRTGVMAVARGGGFYPSEVWALLAPIPALPRSAGERDQRFSTVTPFMYGTSTAGTSTLPSAR